jgi:hypothetical protein
MTYGATDDPHFTATYRGTTCFLLAVGMFQLPLGDPAP